ncbi:Ff.00g008170.m01.CDS01 [Fusarium sp. VM40]|nr:Ff.00g008170.m01.CDS01 [Fusarium sp. VM40]
MSLHIRKQNLEKRYRHLSFLIKNVFASRKTRKEQSDNCLLLHMLPTDVLLQIAEYLPASSKVLLSHTCIVLRNGLDLPTFKELPLADRINYAGILAKDRPDVRVCSSCGCIHAVRKHDSPAVPPRPKIMFTSHNEDCRLVYGHKFPRERHVQLALKYTRLGTENLKHKEILEAILQPVVYTSRDVYGRDHSVKRWKWCKIINGRFLIMTKWTIGIYCYTGPSNEYGLSQLLRQNKFRSCSPHSEFTLTGARACKKNCEGNRCGCEINQIIMARDAAHASVGTPVYAWDVYSAADYAICLTRNSAETCVWEDLGGELPHLDEIQDTKTPGRHGYEPHGVRELFERDGKKWLAEEEFELRQLDKYHGKMSWTRNRNFWRLWKK